MEKSGAFPQGLEYKGFRRHALRTIDARRRISLVFVYGMIYSIKDYVIRLQSCVFHSRCASLQLNRIFGTNTKNYMDVQYYYVGAFIVCYFFSQ